MRATSEPMDAEAMESVFGRHIGSCRGQGLAVNRRVQAALLS